MNTRAANHDVLKPAFALPDRLLRENHLVSVCYQCRKCSSGCPLTFAMDLYPDQLIRLALLGQEAQVLGSNTIWVCSSCETCTTRCPNGIDIAGVMDWLKEEAVQRGRAIPESDVANFHRFFLEAVRDGGGRLPEALLMRRFTLYQIKSGHSAWEVLRNLKLGWKLLRRGRLSLRTHPLHNKKEVSAIFKESGF